MVTAHCCRIGADGEQSTDESKWMFDLRPRGGRVDTDPMTQSVTYLSLKMSLPKQSNCTGPCRNFEVMSYIPNLYALQY
jgi:hypothetical protein